MVAETAMNGRLNITQGRDTAGTRIDRINHAWAELGQLGLAQKGFTTEDTENTEGERKVDVFIWLVLEIALISRMVSRGPGPTQLAAFTL